MGVERLGAVAVAEVPEFGPPPPKIEICGYRECNRVEGRWYECRGPKHGPKMVHQMEAAEEVLE